MENKTPFYKSKVFLIPLALILTAAIVCAAVLFATSHAIVTVGEALTTTAIPMTPSGFPGDTIIGNITITNAALHDLPIEINWTETNNDANVSYTYSGPTSLILHTGDNIINFNWSIATGSNIGNFTGDITLTRV